MKKNDTTKSLIKSIDKKNISLDSTNYVYKISLNSKREIVIFDKKKNIISVFEKNIIFNRENFVSTLDALKDALIFFIKHSEIINNKEKLIQQLAKFQGQDTLFLLGEPQVNWVFDALINKKDSSQLNKILSRHQLLFSRRTEEYLKKYNILQEMSKNLMVLEKAKENLNVGKFEAADSIFKKINKDFLPQEKKDSLFFFLNQSAYINWSYHEKINGNIIEQKKKISEWLSKIPQKTKQVIAAIFGIQNSENIDSIAVSIIEIGGFGADEPEIVVNTITIKLIEASLKNGKDYFIAVLKLKMLNSVGFDIRFCEKEGRELFTNNNAYEGIFELKPSSSTVFWLKQPK